MGFLSDIVEGVGDFLGDVVEGVVDFVDDVFNIDLGKVFGNEIVQFALLASSIFTGGVAIANGVMTGFREFGLSEATKFMTRFVEGAKGFVTGVAEGFLNPVSTFKDITGIGKSAASQAGGALGELASEEVSAASEVLMDAGDAASSVGPAPIDTAVGVDVGTNIGGGAVGGDQVGAAITEGIPDVINSGSQPVDLAAMEVAPPGGDFTLAGQAAQQSPAAAPTAAGAPITEGAPSVVTNAGKIAEGVPDVVTKAGEQAGNQGFWGKLASSAGEFITSPAGVQMGLGMMQGYSQAAMLQKRWDEEREMVRNRARSWSDGTWAPRTWSQTTLQGMRAQQEELDKLKERGQQAQDRWGYAG